MVAAGLTKADVRALSRELGLPTWDKPQLACLSSRFPYGTEITPDRLRRVDRFEDGLRALGFRQLRVRYHGDIARLELETAAMARALEPGVREAIVALGKAQGFAFVALDLGGFQSGSLNQPDRHRYTTRPLIAGLYFCESSATRPSEESSSRLY